jgi:hypothetical protein
MGSAAHYVIGDPRVKLPADRMKSIAVYLVGEIRLAKRQKMRALRQVKTVRMPLIDRAKKRTAHKPIADECQFDSVITDLVTACLRS